MTRTEEMREQVQQFHTAHPEEDRPRIPALRGKSCHGAGAVGE